MIKPQRIKFGVEDFKTETKDDSKTVYDVLTDLPKSQSSIDNAFVGALQILLRDIDLGYLSPSFKNVSLGKFLTLTESELRQQHLLTVDINRIQDFLKSFHLKRWNVRSTLNLDGWTVKMDNEEILLAMIRIVQQLYIDRMSVIYVMKQLRLSAKGKVPQKPERCDVSDDTQRAVRALYKISKKLNIVIKRINQQTEDPVWSFGPCDLIRESDDGERYCKRLLLRLLLPSLIVGVIIWRKRSTLLG